MGSFHAELNDAVSFYEEIYTTTHPNLLLAAERNVFAHLINLCERNLVRCWGELNPEATYEIF